jgi:hypothetical protein
VFIDRFLSKLGCAGVKSGVVVDKHYYDTPVPLVDVYGVGVRHGGVVSDGTTQVVPEESWSLSVRGKARFGSVVVEEKFVDEMAWSKTKIGDQWPLEP